MDVGKPKKTDPRKQVGNEVGAGKTPPKGLLSVPAETYGPQYRDHFLVLYTKFVDTACQTSASRTNANTFFLTANSSLVTLYGILSLYANVRLWHVLVPSVGMLFSVTWWALIHSYRDLSKAKFKVIHEMEEQLPVALYRYEWELMCKEFRLPRPLSHVERIIPAAFFILYFVLLTYGAQSDRSAGAAPKSAASVAVEGRRKTSKTVEHPKGDGASRPTSSRSVPGPRN